MGLERVWTVKGMGEGGTLLIMTEGLEIDTLPRGTTVKSDRLSTGICFEQMLWMKKVLKICKEKH